MRCRAGLDLSAGQDPLFRAAARQKQIAVIRVVQVCTLKQGQPFIGLHPEIMWAAECVHRALDTKDGRGSTASSGRRFVVVVRRKRSDSAGRDLAFRGGLFALGIRFFSSHFVCSGGYRIYSSSLLSALRLPRRAPRATPLVLS